MFVMTLMILAYTLGNRQQFKRGLLAIATIGPLTSLILICLPSYSGWFGVGYNLVAMTPWFVHVIRTKKTSGISGKSILFSFGAISCTLTYAILIGSPQLVTGCAIGLITNSTVLYYYLRYRKA
jgi:uncharacterized protein with PQ loop repeat